MKRTAKATQKAHATRTPKAASSGAITPMVPLGRVLGCSTFYANLYATGGGAIDSADIPFAPPAGVPVWLAVASITGVNYAHASQGGLRGFKAIAEISTLPDGTGLLRLSGEMEFHPQPPGSSLVQQIDVFGQVMFYSA